MSHNVHGVVPFMINIFVLHVYFFSKNYNVACYVFDVLRLRLGSCALDRWRIIIAQILLFSLMKTHPHLKMFPHDRQKEVSEKIL